MAAPKAEATSQVEYDKLNERLTHLEEQVYRLLVALCLPPCSRARDASKRCPPSPFCKRARQPRADRVSLMLIVQNAVTRALQQFAEPQLPDSQRLVAHINAMVREKVERGCVCCRAHAASRALARIT
jgi:hypothetical protein